MMKNDIYFVVIALLVAELFKILILKLRPIQSHLRLNFFPFATKISGEVANLRLIFPLLFRNKKVTSYQFAATLMK